MGGGSPRKIFPLGMEAPWGKEGDRLALREAGLPKTFREQGRGSEGCQVRGFCRCVNKSAVGEAEI